MVVMNHTVGSSVDARLVDEQRALLDLVDKLQVARLENVKLPQIVVVGDQSAGKSSVLEAITGTPFPRDAGACTRFATEIRLRRAPETSLKVSIIPDKNRSYRDQEKLRQFGSSVDSNTPFDALMRLAVELIAPKNIPGRFAARDILVVEKRGPDMPLLTLVNLPGLVRNANNDQSLEDIQTIEALSDRYMKSSRTIILAVVGGNSDYVQAPILTKVRHFDPSGARTIGVLTKPDLTESIGLEDKFIDLVLNNDRRNHFRLGWYVLKNSGPLQQGQSQSWPTPQERKQREDEFFSQGKWSVLPERMRGADALKVALSVQLQRHIGRHVKTLRKQIQKALEACEAELKSLGTGRDTPEEMRIDLVSLFSNSKELVVPALNGWYKNPRGVKFFRSTPDPNGTPVQNLRARATEENERFSDRIRSNGRKFNFTASNPRASIDSPSGPITRDSEKKEFARREVAMLLQQIRGSEFPMDPKPRAVYMLFAEFSEYWPRLAQEHKDNLGVICNEFLSELIDHTWPKRMHDPLRLNYLDNQMKTLMEKAQAELDTLMQDMQFEVQPYDPEYEERIKMWRADISRDGGGPQTEAEEVLEKMLIYYEICAKTFARNIITQVIERHLLQGMSTIFNSIEVLNMDNKTIEAIAAEDRATRDRRLTLKAQKKDIEAARDLCANLAMRKELRMYAEDDRELGEDSSDEEARIKTPSTPSHLPPADSPPSPGPNPSSTRQRQRSSRQPRDEQLQAIPIRQEPPAQVNTGSGSASTYQVSPSTSATVRAPPDLDDYDRLPPRPSAPPPPPRPEKVRTELDSPAPPTADSYYSTAATAPASNRVDYPTNGYHRQAGTGEYGAGPEGMDYLGQGTSRKGIRKVFGRT